MYNKKLGYSFFKYLLETVIIYLILRYTPFINLDQNKALITTILLMIVYFIIEFLFFTLRQNELFTTKAIINNGAKEENCNSCSLKNNIKNSCSLNIYSKSCKISKTPKN